MADLGSLSLRLSEATEAAVAAERLAEYLREIARGAGVRIYTVGPGDQCATCNRARDCSSRERCLHLEASQGNFLRPPGHDKRIPLIGTVWGEALGQGQPTDPPTVPPELAPPEGDAEAAVEEALLVPLEGGGETIGVVGLRASKHHVEMVRADALSAAFLAAAAIRSLRSRITANRRFEQLLLVNELGRKVNSILNDELLLRQAAVDIHRTFGFHTVMIFMVDDNRSSLEMKAQASKYQDNRGMDARVAIGEGIVGRVYRAGRTETIDDVRQEPDYVNWYPDTRSEIAVPIQIGGVVEGVLNVESDQTAAFGPSEKLVLETVANQLAIAIENARLFGMVKDREDRYRTLVESSPGGVLHLDHEGRIIYANPAVTEITGYEKSHILSRLANLAELATEVDRPKLEEAVSGALRGVPCWDLEFHLQHQDLSTRWVSASLQPLIGDHGEPRGVVVLARDRTRERELQDRLSQSEKLSAIGNLVSGVAHELNNPLAGILGFAQLLLGRPPDQWTRQDVEKIEKNARRCQRIVESLLAFARQNRMSKRQANLNEVIDSVLNLNEYQFRMDNVEIVRDFDSTVPQFPIDVNRWQQVFINLASNAHQAIAAEESEERRITFETRFLEDRVLVRVRDTGPGVPDHVKRRIFDPFFTTKETGTGLGLGICFGIVKEHGGTIELENVTGAGASFLIEVPVRSSNLPRNSEPEQAKPVRNASRAGEGRRVLVVDDDSYVCDVVERALQNHRYEVVVAKDGVEALEKAHGAEFDVIVTDVRMPGDIDGVELFETLKAERPDLADRFVFMTGNLLDTRTMGRLENLRVRFVEKPFDIHHLASIVNEIAASRGAARPAS